MSNSQPATPSAPHLKAIAVRATIASDQATVMADATLCFLDGSQAPMATIARSKDIWDATVAEVPALLGETAARIQAQGGKATMADVAVVICFAQAFMQTPRPPAPTAPAAQFVTAPDPQSV